MMLRVALAFVDGKRLEIVEVDLDGPKRDEILVEIRATDICQTDEFTISGAYPESLFPARGLVHECKIEIGPTIIHTVPLKDINKAFDRMHEGKSSTAS